MLQLFAALQMLALNIRGRLSREEDGATAVEYGLMVALIAIVIIGAVQLVGTNLQTVFNDVAANLQGLGGGGGN